MTGSATRPSPRGAPFSEAEGPTLTRRAWLAAALATAASALNNDVGASEISAVARPAILPAIYPGTRQLDLVPLANLERVALLCDFPVREGGEKSWPQGVSINKGAREIYVSNQNGTELRIDVRTIPSGARKSSRTVKTENQCWTEALPWFYNNKKQLCFIIRATGGGRAAASTYAIYNYTTGIKGANIPIKGAWSADVSGRYLATTDAEATSVRNFYVYDWGSVRAGHPALLATIPAQAGSKTAAKNQGLAWVGGYFHLIQGSQSESPTFQAWDPGGRLVLSRKFTRVDFMGVVNKVRPGYLTNAKYTYEAEGACNLDGKLVSMQIVNNNPSVTQAGRVLVLQHNRIDGVWGTMHVAKPLGQ